MRRFFRLCRDIPHLFTVYPSMPSATFPAPLLLLCLALPVAVHAQEQEGSLPDVPGVSSLSGSVVDGDGMLLPGALVEVSGGGTSITETTDSEGLFHVDGLRSGTYAVHVAEAGFTPEEVDVTLQANEQRELPPVQLRSVSAHATVTVTASLQEIATAQLAAEEKQRVLGIIPNFYVAYFPNPAPLTSRQKFNLAWKSTLDPVSLLGVGFFAGTEQAANSFSGYGQGAAGYGKRFAAGFGDSAIGTLLGGAILPSLWHQDPRYFYQGTGSLASRTRHALVSTFLCYGDSGKRQFNYSAFVGGLASAGISNAYYPSTDRDGFGLTMRNAAVGTAFSAFGNLMQEFVVKRLTPHLAATNKP